MRGKNPSSNDPSSGNYHYFAVFVGNTHIKSLDGLDEVDRPDEIWIYSKFIGVRFTPYSYKDYSISLDMLQKLSTSIP